MVGRHLLAEPDPDVTLLGARRLLCFSDRQEGLVDIRQEFLDDVWHEASELTRMHWNEIAINKDVVPLLPDYDVYSAMEGAGALRIFVARESGEMVGYFVLFVRRHPHYASTLFAYNDVLYLRPEARRGLAGWRLLDYAETALREDGVRVMVVNTKIHAPLDSLLSRRGFDLTERVYTKRLF